MSDDPFIRLMTGVMYKNPARNTLKHFCGYSTQVLFTKRKIIEEHIDVPFDTLVLFGANQSHIAHNWLQMAVNQGICTFDDTKQAYYLTTLGKTIARETLTWLYPQDNMNRKRKLNDQPDQIEQIEPVESKEQVEGKRQLRKRVKVVQSVQAIVVSAKDVHDHKSCLVRKRCRSMKEYKETSNPSIKKLCNDLVVDEVQRLCALYPTGSIVLLDNNFKTTDRLLNSGIACYRIFVVECNCKQFDVMNRNNQNRPLHRRVTVMHDLMGDFIRTFNGPPMLLIWYDGITTLEGNKVCHPRAELTRLFHENKLAKECAIASTFSHRSQVEMLGAGENQADYNNLITQLAKDHAYQSNQKYLKSYEQVYFQLHALWSSK